MKHPLSFFLTALTVLNVLACQKPVENENPIENKQEENQTEKPGENTSTTTSGNTIIVYYSFTGNCDAIAKTLQEKITADVVKVEPTATVDYAANGYSIGSDLITAINDKPNDANSYPAIKDVTVDFSKFTNVIVVAPLWWSNMAAPLQTFLFKNGGNMGGKNIGVIVKSSSSNGSAVFSDAKRLIPNGKFNESYLMLTDSNFSNRSSLISDWLKKLGY